MSGYQKISILFLSLFFLFPTTLVKAEFFNCGCVSGTECLPYLAAGVRDEGRRACESFCITTENSQTYTYSDAGGVCGTAIATSTDTTAVEETTSSSTSSGPSYSLTAGISSTTFANPVLSVNIPTVSFSNVIAENGYLEINWLGEYINGLYGFLLSIGGIFAFLMIMIGGIQYVISRGGGEATEAKKRIGNAVTGLVLLFCVFIILYTVNPGMISFDAITIGRIDQVLIEQEVSAGPEGDGDTASLSPSSVGSYTFNFTLGDRCQTVLTSAANDSSITCALENGFLSPTSGGPSCPRGDGSTDAHWGNRGGGAKWDYHSFSTSPLDFKATFGTTIKAPFNGKLTYKPGTGGACGNQISLKSSETGGIVSLCHIKDFAGKKTGDEVLRGEIIGHAGGHYCGATLGGGEPPTEGWFYRDQMIANASGSNVCDDPKIPESCDCQTWQQSGQTTGPHVHITWAQTRAGNFLKCLLEGNHQ